MPKYLVAARGFHNGQLYDPDGKRKTLVTEKPLKPVPTWLQPVKSTAADEKKTVTKQAKDVAASKAKGEEDQKEVKAATFMEGPKSTMPVVETL